MPYAALLWSLRDAVVCPIHAEWLESICPKCHRRSPSTVAEARLPHCSCGHDLRSGRSTRKRSASGWPLAVAFEIGKLVACHAGHPRGLDWFTLVEKLALAPFATTSAAGAYFGFRENYLFQARHIKRTTLENLCRLALGSGLSLAQLLFTSDEDLLPCWNSPVANPTFSRRFRHSSTKLRASLSQQMEFDREPRSIRKHAARLKISRTTLATHCPELFHEVKAAHQLHRKTCGVRTLLRLRNRIIIDKARLGLLPRSVAVRNLGFVRSYSQIVALFEELK